jgi:hypothetical protein
MRADNLDFLKDCSKDSSLVANWDFPKDSNWVANSAMLKDWSRVKIEAWLRLAKGSEAKFALTSFHSS